ncbi:MAG: hypothetical protein P0111_08105 [Nitrospira sp.]|nr:hypothetical protein [Nitrospira sp.]
MPIHSSAAACEVSSVFRLQFDLADAGVRELGQHDTNGFLHAYDGGSLFSETDPKHADAKENQYRR